MDFNEKPQFVDELKKMAYCCGKKIRLDNEEDVLLIEGYWENLKEYPLEVIKRAMNNAIRARDNDPSQYFGVMIKVMEVRTEAQRILQAGPKIGKQMGCRKCINGWIMNKDETGPIAKPCTCRLALQGIKEAR